MKVIKKMHVPLDRDCIAKNTGANIAFSDEMNDTKLTALCHNTNNLGYLIYI